MAARAIENDIFREIGAVADGLGVEAWVVGGFVRDYYLRRPSTDVDIVVVGKEGGGVLLAEALGRKHHARVNVFKNFGTAMLRIGPWELEFVGARKESYRADSRKPLVEDGTMEDDQRRRDFTINAMAIGLNAANFGTLNDPFGGMDDMEAQTLRTPLDPDLTFSDDPLRMVRAIRFAAQLGFDIDPATFDAIGHNARRIEIVSRERISTEIEKIMLSPRPWLGWELFDAAGLLPHIFPQLAALKGVEIVRGRAHKDNFVHTLGVLENITPYTQEEANLQKTFAEFGSSTVPPAPGSPLGSPGVNSADRESGHLGETEAELRDNNKLSGQRGLWLRWAALLHDIGKPQTKAFDDRAGWTFHGHEVVGSKMIPRIFREQRLPMDDRMKYVQKLVFLHLRPIILSEDEVTDSAVRRLLFEAGNDIDDLMTLCEADITSGNDSKVKRFLANFALVRQKLHEIEEKDSIRNFQPPVTGDMIMERYGLKPCSTVGEIKSAIKEAILEGDIENNFHQAFALMERLAARHGLTPVREIAPPDENRNEVL